MSSAREAALRVLTACRTSGRLGGCGAEGAAEPGRLVAAGRGALQPVWFTAWCKTSCCWIFISLPIAPRSRITCSRRCWTSCGSGAYQILFLDKVPDSAAVNRSVELAKLMQARTGCRAGERGAAQALPQSGVLPPIPDRDTVQYLSIRYSHPKWLVKRMLRAAGAGGGGGVSGRGQRGRAPMTVQVNPLKTDAASSWRSWRRRASTAEPHPWVPDCLELQRSRGSGPRWPPFQAGRISGAGPGRQAGQP